MSVSTEKIHPTISEVVYRHLEVVVGALKKADIFALCTLKKLTLQCGMIAIKCYQCVRKGVPHLLGGSNGGWLKSS